MIRAIYATSSNLWMTFVKATDRSERVALQCGFSFCYLVMEDSCGSPLLLIQSIIYLFCYVTWSNNEMQHFLRERQTYDLKFYDNMQT